MPCVAQLNSPADRLAALLAAIATQTEPVVTLTYLLQLCRHEVAAAEAVGSHRCWRGRAAAQLVMRSSQPVRRSANSEVASRCGRCPASITRRVFGSLAAV